MDEPKKKILEMVASGKITVEEAAALLDKVAPILPGPRQIEGPDNGAPQAAEAPPHTETQAPADARPKNPRYLRVMVESAGGDEVNVRVPLSLIKTGIKLGSLMPHQASEAINRSGFDFSMLSGLEGEELMEALRELEVHIESADGDEVQVFCE
jgi:hypothetical protein